MMVWYLILIIAIALASGIAGNHYASMGVGSISLDRLGLDGSHAEIARKEILASAMYGVAASVIAAVLMMLLFVPVFKALTWNFYRILESLTSGADQIANGNYGYTLNSQSNFEVDALAESFNRMSCKLKEQHEAHLKQVALLEEQKQEIEAQKGYA